jgi:beta-glucosidase
MPGFIWTKFKLVPGLWGNLEADDPRTEDQIAQTTEEYLSSMTLDEKIDQMSGDGRLSKNIDTMIRYNQEPLPAGENHRLGIPGIRFSDGPRGVVMYNSTAFPVPMARAASWDIDLEGRIGDAIGVEVRSQGANFFGGVCINLPRHPAWGRSQETFGEDPYLLGEMGAALVRGVQRHIMACVKHFACNSIENSRYYVNVKIDERTLREIYLPHFKRCIDEGVASVMGAYNKVNGEFCCHNRHLLIDILKEEWGFEGFVISDFIEGVKDAIAASSGLDIEMPFTTKYGKHLKRAVQRGRVSEEMIDESVRRILRTKLRFAQIGEPERYSEKAVVSADHVALAREAAAKSMVLLKNNLLEDGKPLLPIGFEGVKSIVVIGKLAVADNTGDHGSSNVLAPYVVTPLEGIRSAVEGITDVAFYNGKRIAKAVDLARSKEFAILVVGCVHHDEGEGVSFFGIRKGGDRKSLRLTPHEEALIKAVASSNPRTVVVLVGGSSFITEAWRHEVPAILMSWYSGLEGGNALADILFGKVNPSAKLPLVFPRSEDQLPFFDSKADSITYDHFHGYRLMDKNGEEPAYPFGFGLSYTSFEYSNLMISKDRISPDEVLTVTVDLSNVGNIAGEEIAQLYVGYEDSRIERAVRDLKGFKKIQLLPGEKQRVTFDLPARHLAFYDVEQGRWLVEKIGYKVFVGPSSREGELLAAHFRIV